jgi:hypothetical protein
MRIFSLGLVLAGSTLLAAAAHAQCSSGYAANGACVNDSLAGTTQLNVIIGLQPMLSSTAYPVMPSDDWTTHYPNQIGTNQQPPSTTGTAKSSPQLSPHP